VAGRFFVAAGDSYFSRFFTKFVEISAAGVATAVSGFVLAHFTGYLNSPPTAALQSPARDCSACRATGADRRRAATCVATCATSGGGAAQITAERQAGRGHSRRKARRKAT
jgi:hypothetical protein